MRLAVVALSIALLAAFLVAPVSAADTNINDYYFTSGYWGAVFAGSTALEKLAYNESVSYIQDLDVGYLPGPSLRIDGVDYSFCYADYDSSNPNGAGYVNIALPLALQNVDKAGSFVFFITVPESTDYRNWFQMLESLMISLTYSADGGANQVIYMGRDNWTMSEPIVVLDQTNTRLDGYYFTVNYNLKDQLADANAYTIRSLSIHFIRYFNLPAPDYPLLYTHNFIKSFHFGVLFDPDSIVTDGDKAIVDSLGSLGDDISDLGDQLSNDIVSSSIALGDKIDAGLKDLDQSLTTPTDVNRDAIADTQDKIDQAADGLANLGDKLNSVDKPPVTAIVPTPSTVLGDAEFFSPSVIDGLIKPVYNSKITLWLVSTVPIFALIGYVLFGKKS